ncbi:PglL family O-oligosaccharyltransferase [Chitinolyticbacter meiyuanensis]|uniref:PglL family O-oligosaccharyltransferase n=1 Tax=Chitinolyticbacter meiyuanensis TaxID=682798 RepID=UPI0011E5E7B6|nr:Wzy polymerase domain-containing protein [Chitinolyticbacter meiyuanensis]
MLRVFQTLLFLLASAPLVVPFRWAPNPVFPSELLAFLLCAALVLAALALPRARTPLPWLSWMWLGLLTALGLQLWLLQPPFLAMHLIAMSYVGVAALVGVALMRAREAYGWERLVTALAWGLLAGALVNSGIGAGQAFQKFTSGGATVFGAIGQANMYGHYLAWGLGALAWLVAQRRAPRVLFWVLAPWLALLLAWCGSRSVLMYAGAWLLLGAAMAWRSRPDDVRRFGRYLLIAAGLVVVAQFVAPLLVDVINAIAGGRGGKASALERISSNGGRRLVEWQKAWQTFVDAPWLGAGWSAYPAHSVALQVEPRFAQALESRLFTHSHSGPLNLLAETGLAGSLPVLAGLLATAAGVWRRRDSAVAWFGGTLVVVSLLHSLVEYPLWYAHFLLPFAVLMFIAWDGAPRWRLPDWSVRTLCVVGGAFALALAAVGLQTYLLIYPLVQPAKNAALNVQRIAQLEKLRKHPLVDFYATFALSNYVVASEADVAWKLAVLDPLNAVRPYPAQLGRAAVLHAMQGDVALGRTLMRQAAFAYPASLAWFRSEPARFQDRYPAMRELVAEVDAADAYFTRLKAERAARK